MKKSMDEAAFAAARSGEAFVSWVAAPFGFLELTATDDALIGCRRAQCPGRGVPNDITEQAARALTDYFSKKCTEWNIPLAEGGTPFRRAVWDALRRVPFGETVSYGELAARIGRPGAARAVGGAVGANPLLIFIPCHRVLAAGGGLGGFSAGLDAKRALLRLETPRGRAEW